MLFQEIFVTVTISCPNHNPFTKRIDVLQLAGRFDSGMVLSEIQKDFPSCRIQLEDVEWVVSN